MRGSREWLLWQLLRRLLLGLVPSQPLQEGHEAHGEWEEQDDDEGEVGLKGAAATAQQPHHGRDEDDDCHFSRELPLEATKTDNKEEGAQTAASGGGREAGGQQAGMHGGTVADSERNTWNEQHASRKKGR